MRYADIKHACKILGLQYLIVTVRTKRSCLHNHRESHKHVRYMSPIVSTPWRSGVAPRPLGTLKSPVTFWSRRSLRTIAAFCVVCCEVYYTFFTACKYKTKILVKSKYQLLYVDGAHYGMVSANTCRCMLLVIESVHVHVHVHLDWS